MLAMRLSGRLVLDDTGVRGVILVVSLAASSKSNSLGSGIFLSSVFSSLSSSSSEGKSAVMSDDSLGGGSLPGQTHVRAKIFCDSSC